MHRCKNIGKTTGKIMIKSNRTAKMIKDRKAMEVNPMAVIVTLIIVLVVVIIVIIGFRGMFSKQMNFTSTTMEKIQDSDNDGIADIYDKCPNDITNTCAAAQKSVIFPSLITAFALTTTLALQIVSTMGFSSFEANRFIVPAIRLKASMSTAILIIISICAFLLIPNFIFSFMEACPSLLI